MAENMLIWAIFKALKYTKIGVGFVLIVQTHCEKAHDIGDNIQGTPQTYF